MASPSPEPTAAAPQEKDSKQPSQPASPKNEAPEIEEQAKDTTQTTEAEDAAAAAAVPSNGDWQAIFSPQHSAYYFYNTKTQQTTWENPVQPPPAQPEASTSARVPSQYEAAAIAGIDPALAHLDPTLGAGPGGSGGSYAAAARFNARSGRFTAMDARDPSHMSEYERAKRMSEFYFDVDAWQKQRDQEQEAAEAESKKRKRPTKKDLVRFSLSLARLHIYCV